MSTVEDFVYTNRETSIVRAGLRLATRAVAASGSSGSQWSVEYEGHRGYLVRSGVRVNYLKPLPHQIEIIENPARYKAKRWGRRAGKTRSNLICAIEGHGPIGTWYQGDEPYRQMWTGRKHRGILAGKDVVWLARDHKQGNVLWNEEVKAKFKGKPFIYVNEVERSVTFEGAGTLYIRSNENVDSIRGIGDSLGGVIVDEAAHLYLRYALREVLMPALADNEGWILLTSTTNAGSDHDPEYPIGPSFFNVICQAVQDSEKYRASLKTEHPNPKPVEYRGEEWIENHRTARDNPRITANAFAALKAEYPEGSHSWAQEGEASLLKGLFGLAFPEWEDALHVREIDVQNLESWRWQAGLDGGFSSPGRFVLGAFGPGKREHLAAELSFNGHADSTKNLPPLDVGRLIGRWLEKQTYLPEFIIYDQAMDATGDGRGGVRISEAEEVRNGMTEVLKLRTPPMIAAAKGPGSRRIRALLFHQSLKATRVKLEMPDGTEAMVVPPWGMPKFSVSKIGAPDFYRSVPQLSVDPADADCYATDGVDDHSIDSWCYLTHSRPLHSAARPARRGEHQHPGIGKYLEKDFNIPEARPGLRQATG